MVGSYDLASQSRFSPLGFIFYAPRTLHSLWLCVTLPLPFISLDTPPLPWDTLPMFSATLLDHFQFPRNAGELSNPTAKIQVTNPVCGDVLQLSAILENGRIAAVRFLCRGCTASIACASLLTEKIQGRELDELHGLTADSLSSALGGLPAASAHAAQLAHDALRTLLHRLRPTP